MAQINIEMTCPHCERSILLVLDNLGTYPDDEGPEPVPMPEPEPVPMPDGSGPARRWGQFRWVADDDPIV